MDRGSSAARQAAVLFLAGAALAVTAPLRIDVASNADIVWLGLANLLWAAVAWALPWDRWPRLAQLVLAVPAFAITMTASLAGITPTRSYGLLYVVIAAWIALNFGRVTARWTTALIAVAYTVPLMGRPVLPPFDPGGLLVTVASCVLASEIIGRAVERARDAKAAADRTSERLRLVAAVSQQLQDDDPETVLARSVDAVMTLGFDGANVSVIDDRGDTFLVQHARGMAARSAGQRFPTRTGLTGMVLRSRNLVTVDDYQELEGAHREIASSGARSAVGAPLDVDGRVAAVLVVFSAECRDLPPEDIEALRLIAVTAGAAVSRSLRMSAHREAAARHEYEALTDDLTGVGSRRSARLLLDTLKPGDGLVFIDADHFKQVNDQHGHAVGDELLASLGAFLIERIRPQDGAARYGGEEFLVILRQSGDRTAQVAERMINDWRMRGALTTISAGVAVHTSTQSPAVTSAHADAALYEAKRRGRDGVVDYDEMQSTPTVSTAAGDVATESRAEDLRNAANVRGP